MNFIFRKIRSANLLIQGRRNVGREQTHPIPSKDQMINILFAQMEMTRHSFHLQGVICRCEKLNLKVRLKIQQATYHQGNRQQWPRSRLEVITGRVIISARSHSNRPTARNEQPSARGRTLGSGPRIELQRRLRRIKVEKRGEKATQVQAWQSCGGSIKAPTPKRKLHAARAAWVNAGEHTSKRMTALFSPPIVLRPQCL